MISLVHCETWAGTAEEPYETILARDPAVTPWGAVRRLTYAAERLADALDTDPADARPFPSATLRRWMEDRRAHEDIADWLGRGAYVTEAVSMTGPGRVLYTLTAMPARGCICRMPLVSSPAFRILTEARR
ncbi:hypothetical protein [Streptomyces sp. NPDC055607]